MPTLEELRGMGRDERQEEATKLAAQINANYPDEFGGKGRKTFTVLHDGTTTSITIGRSRLAGKVSIQASALTGETVSVFRANSPEALSAAQLFTQRRPVVGR